MLNLNELMYGEKYPIVDVKFNEEKIELYVESKSTKCYCPECGEKCTYIHAVHIRHIQDTPIHNKETWINLAIKEYECSNKKCNTKTFTEDIPFVGRKQVMTYYLQYYITCLAIYMSSSTTSLILSLIGVKASADTVDNILKKIEIKDDPDIEEIGIDDVALRKGINYATAIYNLKTHQLIALLKGREKEDIIPWLKEHPKIKLVARDRASAYAEAITEVFPDAIQIADRFHLFENIVKYLKDILYQELPDKIVIKNGEVIDKKATKVLKELANIDETILNNLNYDNKMYGNIKKKHRKISLNQAFKKSSQENAKKENENNNNIKINFNESKTNELDLDMDNDENENNHNVDSTNNLKDEDDDDLKMGEDDEVGDDNDDDVEGEEMEGDNENENENESNNGANESFSEKDEDKNDNKKPDENKFGGIHDDENDEDNFDIE